MRNIVCLGDPRMDDYVKGNPTKKSINNIKPTVVIGAGGFNVIDLNSYVAYEFDFLNDIITACKILLERGREMDLIIKVRQNGYIKQYEKFMCEYFRSIPVKLYDDTPMIKILSKADFYISIYSQTLFETSCFGIPVLYYKKDTEVIDPPFDGKSELVTAFSVADIVEKMEKFYNGDTIFDKFKDKEVMEKYIGPLDGNALERNMEFIYSLIFDEHQLTKINPGLKM